MAKKDATHYESSDKIWREGCGGHPMSGTERQSFQVMARNRFNTFEMSAAHAIEYKSPEDADDWIKLLVTGLAKELLENPGLEREWQGSDFSDRLHGRSVSIQLNQRANQ